MDAYLACYYYILSSIDPIVRLFSEFDPLYPLIDDLGEDGSTPWVSGPPRTLRPIVKAILEAWDGWPGFRDNARYKLGQNYRSVGEQFILLPEPGRYLTDKLISVNTDVPAVDSICETVSAFLYNSFSSFLIKFVLPISASFFS